MTGYIVFAHGSSVESANQAVRTVAAEFAQRGEFEHVIAAFLEGGEPDLNQAIRELANRQTPQKLAPQRKAVAAASAPSEEATASCGALHIVVIPYFLTLGLHLQRDLPKLIEQARLGNPGVEIEVTAPLDGHPAMVEALLDRAQASVCRRG